MTAHLNSLLDNKRLPTILTALRDWGHLRNHPKWSWVQLSLNLPISALSYIIPDINLKSWKEKGIQYIEDVVDGSSVKSFLTLHKEYSQQNNANTLRLLNSLKGTEHNNHTTHKDNPILYTNPKQIKRDFDFILRSSREKLMCQITVCDSMGEWIGASLSSWTMGKNI